MKTLNLSFLLLLLLFVSRSVQSTEIKGRVIDAKTKKPIDFALTFLLRTDSVYVAGAQTNESGYFNIKEQLQKRAYILKISSLGYRTVYI